MKVYFVALYQGMCLEVGVGDPASAPRFFLSVSTAVAFVLTGCTSDGVDVEPGPPNATSRLPTSSAAQSSVVDPRALPALRAYSAFIDAAREAQRHPFGLTDRIPAGANFLNYSFDPFRGEYRAYILGLSNQGGEYRGTPPTLNVRVEKVALKAKPWPSVSLSDCQTNSDGWRLYDAETGEVQARATLKVDPPYRVTVTMIEYDGHWGIQKLTADSSRTCVP